MEKVEAIRSLTELDATETEVVAEISARYPEWASAGLLLYVVAVGRQVPQRYVAPADPGVTVGDAVVAHGTWEHILDRASSDGIPIPPLAIVDRLIVRHHADDTPS